MLRLRSIVCACAVGAAGACSLVVDTDGLSGGAVGVAPDAAQDVLVLDASDGGSGEDGAPPQDSGGDARCADAGNDPSLVLYLTFDEDAGTTALDCSGRGHDGLIVGSGATSHVAGHTSGALSFDGTNTCVVLGTPTDLILLTPFTVAAWVMVDAYSTGSPDYNSRTILGKTADSTQRGWRFVTQGDDAATGVGFKVGTDAGSASVTSPGPQPVSQWIHVAGVWVPNTRAEVYVGGILVKTDNTIPPILEDTAQSLYAGCIEPGAQHFKGTLDELRIYSRALTASEIAQLAK